jgi:hypothetical protein
VDVNEGVGLMSLVVDAMVVAVFAFPVYDHFSLVFLVGKKGSRIGDLRDLFTPVS